ncbi:hypothetical protein MYA_0001 [Burkholderia sp. KJ006]|nr:hypothetical protein MYA_0001 [Burkholderia sp. KJ006]
MPEIVHQVAVVFCVHRAARRRPCRGRVTRPEAVVRACVGRLRHSGGRAGEHRSGVRDSWR